MKKIFAFAIAFACAATFAYAQPKLQVEGGDTYDWGKVKPTQTPLKTNLTIKNTGTEELKISDVHVGCGCTTTGLEKKNLAPGESTSMSVSVNVGSNTGAISKSVTITSNDPTSPSKIIMLKADIVRTIQFTPSQYLTFSDMKVGTEATAKIKVKNSSDKDITLSNPEASNGLRVNLKKQTVLKAGGEIELEAKIIPEKEGYFNGSVKLATTDPDMPTLEIPAYGNVTANTSNLFLKNK